MFGEHKAEKISFTCHYDKDEIVKENALMLHQVYYVSLKLQCNCLSPKEIMWFWDVFLL